ncbi:MAG: protein translocase subunit SecF [Candidatus Tenebribacter burtonii]|jgi:preprotein translocase SecF subunit|nr:protein translocase subunit SecF [Candidatus Tenebribacter burtonii]
MKFFGKTKIDFIGKRRIAFAISLVIILAGIVSLVINKGPKYSIDFTGGVAMELDLTPVKDGAQMVKVQDIRDALTNAGIQDAEIQEIKGSEGKQFILIKTQIMGGMKDKTSTKVIEIIKKEFPDNVNPETLIRLQEEVGPKIGEELKGKAILAIFWALLGIILYIWWRFEFTFGLTAVAALFHDILITIGIFSILGIEISLSIVAALLTIVGYSLNDTIVVFDRIREDLKLYRKEPYGSVINHSINETLSRTIITSLTTFVVVLSLYLFGGSVIHDFAFAILVGVIVGTYSSIFVASPLMVEHFNKREKKLGTRSKKR